RAGPGRGPEFHPRFHGQRTVVRGIDLSIRARLRFCHDRIGHERETINQNGSAREARVSERIFLPSSVVTVMLGNRWRTASWAWGMTPTSKVGAPGRTFGRTLLATVMMVGARDRSAWTVGRGSETDMAVNSFGKAVKALVNLASAFQVGSSPL